MILKDPSKLEKGQVQMIYSKSTDICICLHDELGLIEEDCLYPSEIMKKNNQQMMKLYEQLNHQI